MIFGVQINFMRFFTAFYKNNVFTIAFVVWAFIVLIYMIATCNRKPSYLREIEKIRQRDTES